MRFTQSFPLRFSVLAWLALLPFALLSLSCSNGLQSVSGKVLLKSQPIKGAIVTFHPAQEDIKAQLASAVTNEDGTFTMTTGKETGVAPGQYVVTVVWLKESPVSTKITLAPPADPVDQLQGRYAIAKTSQIKVEIKPGTSQLEPFKLD